MCHVLLEKVVYVLDLLKLPCCLSHPWAPLHHLHCPDPDPVHPSPLHHLQNPLKHSLDLHSLPPFLYVKDIFAAGTESQHKNYILSNVLPGTKTIALINNGNNEYNVGTHVSVFSTKMRCVSLLYTKYV